VTAELGPAQRRGVPDGVADIESRAADDQQADRFEVVRPNGLVERRRMGMVALGVVPIWVLACVEEQLNDLGVAMLRGERECPMAYAG
jgi:hypothetical protein